MRRLVVAATAAAVAFAASGGPVAGQAEPSTPPAPGKQVVHSWALAPAGSADPGEAGNRSSLSYDVDRGAKLDDAVTLFNYSNVQLTFRVYATDALNNEDGQFDVLRGDQEPSDVGSWITLPQEHVTVPPRAQVRLPFTLTVPDDARPGDHAGAILASSAARGTGPDGKVVTLDRRTGARVYLRVAGALRPELGIESVRTTYEPALNPMGGSADVTYRIVNRGNVRLAARHSVSIAGPLGIGKRSADPEEVPELLPGESVTIRTQFDDVAATAIAFTTVRLEPENDSAAAVEAVSRRTMTLAPPLTLVFGALALWMALRARRAYGRHRRDELALETHA